MRDEDDTIFAAASAANGHGFIALLRGGPVRRRLGGMAGGDRCRGSWTSG